MSTFIVAAGSSLTGLVHNRVQARLRRVDAPACHARFLKHCEAYISANIRQAELRERGEVPDLDAFIPLRREHSGVPICIGVIGFVVGRDIPDEVFEHPVMTRLYLAAVDMVWLANVSSVLVAAEAPSRTRRLLSRSPNNRTSTRTIESRRSASEGKTSSRS